MDSISELRHLTPRPFALAEPGYQTAKAGAVTALARGTAQTAKATAPDQSPSGRGASEPNAQPAAQARAEQAPRPQRPEHRWNENRFEREQARNSMGVPEIELSFADFIDLINPLHHIPIIGTIYRAITGDEISGPVKIMGGLLFGGPVGFITSIANTVMAEETGRNLGETVLAAFVGDDATPLPQVAAAPAQGATSPQVEAPQVEALQTEALQIDAPQIDAVLLSALGNSAPAAKAAMGLVSGAKDPFGLQRRMAVPIVAPPTGQAAVAQASVVRTELSKRTAAPQIASLLGAAAPEPPAAAIPGLGLTTKPPNTARREATATPVPTTIGAPTLATGRVLAETPRPEAPQILPGSAPVEAGFADRMLEALDKYQALASERERDNRREVRRLDLDL